MQGEVDVLGLSEQSALHSRLLDTLRPEGKMYRNPIPTFPVIAGAYPARSTKCSLALRTVSEPGCLEEMWIVKMQWDRVEAMFMGVCRMRGRRISPSLLPPTHSTSAIIRLVSPKNSQLRAAKRTE